VKPKDTRQTIISEQIELTRRAVIELDLEVKFLNHTKSKLQNGEIELNKKDILDILDNKIKVHEDDHKMTLNRLFFLKQEREISKAKRLEKKVQHIKSSTPDEISVSVEEKE